MAEGDDLTAKELAAKYVAELEAWVNEQRWPAPPQESALFQWERWISDDPERAWPVFVEVIALRSGDETLYQVACRLRLLLWQDFEAFHERAGVLVRETPCFARICGEGFFDPERYREQPIDVEELMRSHEEMPAMPATRTPSTTSSATTPSAPSPWPSRSSTAGRQKA